MSSRFGKKVLMNELMTLTEVDQLILELASEGSDLFVPGSLTRRKSSVSFIMSRTFPDHTLI